MSEPQFASPDAHAAGAGRSEPAARPDSSIARLLMFIEEHILLNIATVLMAASMVIMFYEACSRTLLSESHWWAEEAVRFLVVWSIMLAFGIATRKGNYIRMDLFVSAMPHAFQRAAAWLNCLAGLLFAILVVIAGTIGVMHLHRVGMYTESNLDLPLWIVRLALPIGAAFYALYFVTVAVALLRGEDEAQSNAH